MGWEFPHSLTIRIGLQSLRWRRDRPEFSFLLPEATHQFLLLFMVAKGVSENAFRRGTTRSFPRAIARIPASRILALNTQARTGRSPPVCRTNFAKSWIKNEVALVGNRGRFENLEFATLERDREEEKKRHHLHVAKEIGL